MASRVNHPRPDFVFVGTKTYEVMFLDEQEWARNHLSESDAGLTYASSNQIYVRLLPGATEANVQQVLLHEILHAVWAETHLTHLLEGLPENPDDKEEMIVGMQAPALLFVIQQNPQLVAYLTANGAVRR